MAGDTSLEGDEEKKQKSIALILSCFLAFQSHL